MSNRTVLVTGSQGFIGSYLCMELLNKGYGVIGIDNYSKYGYVKRHHDNHKNFRLIVDDALFLNDYIIPEKIDFVVGFAAMIGGISYFHKFPYDLLASNERLTASLFDFSIDRYKRGELERIINISSSMVFESTELYPTPEIEIKRCSPPLSTYGFQKLSTEYFCKGAFEQYDLPYTIIRPFNCVGVGEEESLNEDKLIVGNYKMMMSHVLPDLVNRVFNIGEGIPLPILGSGEQIRHYTNGKDLARGIVVAMESEKAVNEDFNLSSDRSTSVIELSRIIYDQIYGKDSKLTFEHLEPFHYDIQKRVPDIQKAKDILGFSCEVTLEESVKEVIDWIRSTIC